MFQFLLKTKLSELFGLPSITFYFTFIVLWLLVHFPFIFSFLIAFVIYLIIGGWRFQKIVLATVKRDLRALYVGTQLKNFLDKFRSNNETVGLLFHHNALKHPDKTCFLYLDDKWTFKQVDDYANKVANGFAELGFKAGDDVALFMENRPEYVGIWLGLSRIGVVTALINSNLQGPSLQHSISVVNCKAVICSSTLLPAILNVASQLKEVTHYYCLGNYEVPLGTASVTIQPFEALIKESSTKLPTFHEAKCSDRLFYVYTSGTTGLPKAAIIRHTRFALISGIIHFALSIKKDDILYVSLPLYHASGGVAALAQCLLFGCTLVLRPRFSASRFWEDCIKYNCTVTLYIGELCRYLAQPPKPTDRQHSIRLMIGNGLRQEIWEKFVNRFGIKHIGEFYGSTEGNSNCINFEGKVGAIGFVSIIMPSNFPLRLIKVDPDTGDPLRDQNGLCIPCKPGEPGEAIGEINPLELFQSFDGYVDKKATSKKIVGNVFKKGDFFFRSGDLLMMDEYGYLYFVDRGGDTFRYRGENVSTTEVEGIFSSLLGGMECVCYGVEVPGMEGRAGMIAIEDPEDKADVNAHIKDLKKALPPYAIPIFIRKKKELQKTGTYKYKKVDLKKEAFNPAIVQDPLYFLHPGKGCYVTLDAELYDQIHSGKIRL